MTVFEGNVLKMGVLGDAVYHQTQGQNTSTAWLKIFLFEDFGLSWSYMEVTNARHFVAMVIFNVIHIWYQNIAR